MPSNRNMDELLKWSIAAQGQGASGDPQQRQQPNQPSMVDVARDIQEGRRPDLADPGLLDAIMGKSEAQMMQEQLAVALDEKRAVEDRSIALDNFEMLIEQIDNANNIASMGMWPPILSLLDSPHMSLRVGALWILGTAVQNNDKAQAEIVRNHPACLGRVLALLRDGSGGQGVGSGGGVHVAVEQTTSDAAAETRKKALYALSNLLKHNPAAVLRLEEDGGFGWQTIRDALKDPSLALRRKAAFLINSLLLQGDEYASLFDALREEDGQRQRQQRSTAQSVSRPVGLLAAPPATDSASQPVAGPTTSVTAVDDGPTTATASPGARPSHDIRDAAPLEPVLPATLRDFASTDQLPSVARQLYRHGVVTTLLLSLLPTTTSTSGADAGAAEGQRPRLLLTEEDLAERPGGCGVDGEGDEARLDDDYAEKASRALLSFASRWPEDEHETTAAAAAARKPTVTAREARLWATLRDQADEDVEARADEDDDAVRRTAAAARRGLEKRWQRWGWDVEERRELGRRLVRWGVEADDGARANLDGNVAAR